MQLNFAVQSHRCIGTGKPYFGKEVPKIDIDLFSKKAILKKKKITVDFSLSRSSIRLEASGPHL